MNSVKTKSNGLVINLIVLIHYACLGTYLHIYYLRLHFTCTPTYSVSELLGLSLIAGKNGKNLLEVKNRGALGRMSSSKFILATFSEVQVFYNSVVNRSCHVVGEIIK